MRILQRLSMRVYPYATASCLFRIKTDLRTTRDVNEKPFHALTPLLMASNR